MKGRNWEGRERSERHERQVVADGEMRIRGGCMVVVQWVVDPEEEDVFGRKFLA